MFAKIPAVAVLPALIALTVAPALALQSEDAVAAPGEQPVDHANESPTDVTALPSNDLSTSMADKVSSPGFSTDGSLHTSAKVLNNAATTNDLKAAFKAARPAEPAPKPAMGAIAAPKPAPAGVPATEPATAAPSSPVNAELEQFQLQVSEQPAVASPSSEERKNASRSSPMIFIIAGVMVLIAAAVALRKRGKR
jgi:hypothetical protein